MAAEFSFPQPASTLAYQQAFGCALRFGQPATRLLLADTDLATALPSYSPDLQALHEQFIDAQINLLSHTGITDKVRELIMQSLDRGEPRREDIAARLGLTDRTLQRRLRAEDSSFQVLLDQARCELARKYLAQQELPLAAMTDLLGFGDASNFFRACKRWFHQPPGEYRKSLMAGQRTPEAAPALEHLS